MKLNQRLRQRERYRNSPNFKNQKTYAMRFPEITQEIANKIWREIQRGDY